MGSGSAPCATGSAAIGLRLVEYVSILVGEKLFALAFIALTGAPMIF